MKGEIKRWIEEDGPKFLRAIGLKNGQTVLDFGCGEGHYTIPAAKVVGRNGRVYALDKDNDILEKLQETVGRANIENVELINENSRIPLPEDSVDVVLGYDVIHFAEREERKAIYKEVRRVLKKQVGLFSVYPKHHKEDYPLRELAEVDLQSIIEEIEEADFILENKFLKRLLHDEYYNEGYVLNFRRS